MKEVHSFSDEELEAFIVSLEPLRGTSRERCFVCAAQHSADSKLEEHHVWPREYGGTTYPTVMLCPYHHSYVHDLAVKIISKVSRGKPTPKLVVSTNGSANNVVQLVRIIVTAWSNPTVRRKTLQVSFEDTDFDDFFVVKTHCSLSDKETILYAVRMLSKQLRGD